ncbi:MAG: hypothetical protein K0S67_1731 [Nitrososphaeraceae archaeon]|jgi:hypothetical protein|nr:hypothetical protein [Nitrososphaeraceae archaeon]MDF2767777.1 hypothetical protein [Nitrososphaeraceae archaeon]
MKFYLYKREKRSAEVRVRTRLTIENVLNTENIL